MYRIWYQDEHMNVSMVSVSRRPGPPQRGQVVFTNPGTSARGEPPFPVIWMSCGSTTGRRSGRSGTVPHDGQ